MPLDDHVESPAMTTAVKAFNSLTREQKSVLSCTLDGFAACLVPLPSEQNKNEFAREVIQENVWHNRINWGVGEWGAWETWGWYRHFCGSVRPAPVLLILRCFTSVCLTFFFAVFGVFANVLDHVRHCVVDANRGVHRPCCYLGEKALECCYRCRGGVRLDGSIVILLLCRHVASHDN